MLKVIFAAYRALRDGNRDNTEAADLIVALQLCCTSKLTVNSMVGLNAE
jgi:hypothetical protein